MSSKPGTRPNVLKIALCFFFIFGLILPANQGLCEGPQGPSGPLRLMAEGDDECDPSPGGTFDEGEAPESPIRLHMPFPAGQTWMVGGKGATGGSYFGNNWHINCIDDYYATDWNRADGIASLGSEVQPVANGTVHYVHNADEDDHPLGNYVDIVHEAGDVRLLTRYAHLQKIYLSKDQVGETIRHWEVIGTVGSTGNSTGPHLHLSFKKEVANQFASRCNGPKDWDKCPNEEDKKPPQTPKPSPMWTSAGLTAIEDGHAYTSVNTRGQAGGYDCSDFIDDLSYADGSWVSPSILISKGWRLENCGDTIWSPYDGYRIVRVAGDIAQESYDLPDDVAPGRTYDLYVDIWVPTEEGRYMASYRLEGPGGPFGVEFWVDIQVRPLRKTVIVDDGDSGFILSDSPYWWRESIGYSGDMYWTYVNGNEVSNKVRWKPKLKAAGNYDVHVFIPRNHATARSASYRVRCRGGRLRRTVTVNQSIYYDQWVKLGTFYFKANGNEWVKLTDATGESPGTYRKIGFDAVRWRLK